MARQQGRHVSRGKRALNAAVAILLLILFSPLIVTLLVLDRLYAGILHLSVVLFWLRRGKEVLFVYSNSPHSQGYMEANILPGLQDRAVVLNWSERSNWRELSLAPACFHHFGGARDFNPMAIVFRRFRRAKVFRFFQAFRDFKHGNARRLDRTGQELFEYLGADGPSQPRSSGTGKPGT